MTKSPIDELKDEISREFTHVNGLEYYMIGDIIDHLHNTGRLALWQDISMSPKGVAEILCLNVDTGEIRVAIRKLFSDSHFDGTGRHWYEWFRNDEICPGHTFSIDPTHWQPLPAAPKQKGTGDEN